MARRRMFSLDIVDTDFFLDLPVSSQNLYFHLAMRADDDGFVSSPKRIMGTIKGSDDDMRLLVLKGFIIPFETGICVITHWRIHNYIQADRYKETIYTQEKKELTTDDVGKYQCIHDVSMADTQVRLGKVSQGKISIEKEERAKALISPNSKKSKEEDRLNLPQYGYGYPVRLSEQEYKNLLDMYGEEVILKKIDDVSLWQPKDGKRPKNDYLTILNWIRREGIKKKAPSCKCGLPLNDKGVCPNPECDTRRT